MKQYQLTRFGIDDLALVDAPEPAPGHRDMVERWHAWSLNSRDLLLVEGHLAPELPLPFTPARLSSALLKCPRSRSSIDSQAEITTNTNPIK